MHSTITDHSIADEIILMNSAKCSWCTMGEKIICLAFLRVDKLLIWNVQLKCSSMCIYTPRNFINVTCSNLCTFIDDILVHISLSWT